MYVDLLIILIFFQIKEMATALPTFSAHQSSADSRWKKWINQLHNLLIGLDIKDELRKRALLLHHAGEEVNDIFDTLAETVEDFKTAVTNEANNTMSLPKSALNLKFTNFDKRSKNLTKR